MRGPTGLPLTALTEKIRILDFTNRADKIEIEEGARRFDQLEILKDGEDVVVAFGDTVITIRDVAARSIGAEDFLF